MGHYMGRHWSSLLDPTHVLDNPTHIFRTNKTRPEQAEHTQSDVANPTEVTDKCSVHF